MFLPVAGKFSDKYGNVKMLFALYPFLWIFIKNPVELIFIPQLIIGVGSAGFAISTTNFIYDTVTPQRRGICTAYMNVLIGIGIFLGSITGGLIIKYASLGLMKPILIAFAISSFLRALVTVIFLPQIKEKERTEKLPKFGFNIREMFRIINGEGRGLKESIQQTLLAVFPIHKIRGKKKD